MIQAYDHRAASAVFDVTNWSRKGKTVRATAVQHADREYAVQPRWWIDQAAVEDKLSGVQHGKMFAFKNVTSPTNQRTMIASYVPHAGVIHSAPLIFTGEDVSVRGTACLLANLNSFVYDFVCRQKIGGVNLSYFIINQIPTLPPDTYSEKCPWAKRMTLEKWISDRVLKLTCTANDMIPLAEAAGFDPPVHPWKPAERADLMAQLDAAYFLLYGIEREEVEYMLSTFQGVVKEEPSLLDASGTVDLILKHYDLFREKTKA